MRNWLVKDACQRQGVTEEEAGGEADIILSKDCPEARERSQARWLKPNSQLSQDLHPRNLTDCQKQVNGAICPCIAQALAPGIK